ncbi:MAG TPA: hypothetical protein VGG15_09230 [Terriglobales bacterium]|jgi:hypothetical protein
MYIVQRTAKTANVNDPDGNIPVVIGNTARQSFLHLIVAQNDCGPIYDEKK